MSTSDEMTRPGAPESNKALYGPLWQSFTKTFFQPSVLICRKSQKKRLQKLAQGNPSLYPRFWVDTPGQSNGFPSVFSASPVLAVPPLRDMGRVGKSPPSIARSSSPIVIETPWNVSGAHEQNKRQPCFWKVRLLLQILRVLSKPRRKK
jgi:hypothetical protein